eukprot:3057812-Rhodomonas_salina.1
MAGGWEPRKQKRKGPQQTSNSKLTCKALKRVQTTEAGSQAWGQARRRGRNEFGGASRRECHRSRGVWKCVGDGPQILERKARAPSKIAL